MKRFFVLTVAMVIVASPAYAQISNGAAASSSAASVPQSAALIALWDAYGKDIEEGLAAEAKLEGAEDGKADKATTCQNIKAALDAYTRAEDKVGDIRNALDADTVLSAEAKAAQSSDLDTVVDDLVWDMYQLEQLGETYGCDAS